MKKVEVKEVGTSRRSFLKISGLTLAGTGLLLAGCSSDDDSTSNNDQLPGVRNGKFDLGGGDLGILTYAYALEQLEADFYTRVVNGNTFGLIFNSEEQAILSDLYAHEVIHREFFKAALTGALEDDTRVLPTLEFAYASVNFGNRASVLGTAKALEDTGVSAYNGAGRYIQNSEYLLLAGKIVSVEARHASAIRSLLNPGTDSFAGDDVVTTTQGLDKAERPGLIIPQVAALNLIQTPFTANYLP
ncbi:ferritin-like domain-containing protein [Flavobacterium sp. DGU11]|uniref:Ferritin-like domain-containing protein n=1 Tax=Flavobacterium arundinis TaxID=3139143 RepID=A0ABU9I0X5_9FLAO